MPKSMFTLKNIAVITLVLFSSLLLINLTSHGSFQDMVNNTGACDDIGDPPDIEAEPAESSGSNIEGEAYINGSHNDEGTKVWAGIKFTW